MPGSVLMILRSALGILPYGMLAFALAVVGRSTALGIAGTLGYMLGEGIIIAILESIGGIAADFREIAIGHHVSSLIAANRIGTGDYNSIAARETSGRRRPPRCVGRGARDRSSTAPPSLRRLLHLPAPRPALVRPLKVSSD